LPPSALAPGSHAVDIWLGCQIPCVLLHRAIQKSSQQSTSRSSSRSSITMLAQMNSQPPSKVCSKTGVMGVLMPLRGDMPVPRTLQSSLWNYAPSEKYDKILAEQNWGGRMRMRATPHPNGRGVATSAFSQLGHLLPTRKCDAAGCKMDIRMLTITTRSAIVRIQPECVRNGMTTATVLIISGRSPSRGRGRGGGATHRMMRTARDQGSAMAILAVFATALCVC
jgi:hypothetical protein